MLKPQIIAALAQAKRALQDLVVTVQFARRADTTYVPGTVPSYAETLADVGIVFNRFETKEIDGDRIRSSDWRGLVFVETNVPPMDTNDIIRVPAGVKDVVAGDYRVIYNDKVMAGDTVVLNQLQLRKQ